MMTTILGTGNKISYHRCVAGCPQGFNLSTLSQDTSSKHASIPYYELHGGFLSFICKPLHFGWGLALYLPGLVGRPHFLQTIASKIFPTHNFVVVSKDGRNLQPIHGVIGLIFSVCASAQGHRHVRAHDLRTRACVCLAQTRLIAVCAVYRVLGRTLLVVAVCNLVWAC